MRLTKQMRLKRRRGMSFIEVLTSLVVTVLMVSMLLSTISILRKTNEKSKVYSHLNMYVVNKLDEIHVDCDAGVVIDAENYNDDGTTSGVWADVIITDVADGFGKPLYLVEIKAQKLDRTENITAQAFVREGCVAYAP